MMKRRGMVLAALSLVMGLIAAWGANNWVQGRIGEEATAANVTRVAAAALGLASSLSLS